MIATIFRLIFNSMVIFLLLIVFISYMVGFLLGKESVEKKAVEKGYGRYERVLTDYKSDGTRNVKEVFYWKDEKPTPLDRTGKQIQTEGAARNQS